jgi:hypothetical protein
VKSGHVSSITRIASGRRSALSFIQVQRTATHYVGIVCIIFGEKI